MSIAATTNSEPAHSNPLMLPAHRGHRLRRAGRLAVLRLVRSASRWRCFMASSAPLRFRQRCTRAASSSHDHDHGPSRGFDCPSSNRSTAFGAFWPRWRPRSFILVMTQHKPSSWPRRLFEAATVPLRGPFQLISDVIGALRHMTTLERRLAGLASSLDRTLEYIHGICQSVLVGQSADRATIDAYRFARVVRYLRTLADRFLDYGIGAIWPFMRRRIRPAKTRHAAGKRQLRGFEYRPSLRRSRHVAFTDPVQPAVRATERARPDLISGPARACLMA